MEAQEQNGDFIAVPKDTLKCMMADFEHLLEDFESIAEVKTMKLARKRLADIKSGKTKTIGEKEFREFMKKKGIE